MKTHLYREEDGQFYEDDAIGIELEIPDAILLEHRALLKRQEEIRNYFAEKVHQAQKERPAEPPKECAPDIEIARAYCRGLMRQYENSQWIKLVDFRPKEYTEIQIVDSGKAGDN